MRRLLLSILTVMAARAVLAQGLPFMRTYTAADYHANSYNYDVATSSEGTVYVANFEGVLYYDYVEWRIIHTPDITRVTVVYCDDNDVVWVGGYNFFGRIDVSDKGELYLNRVGPPDLFRGELQEIWFTDGVLYFLVDDGFIYKLDGDKVVKVREVSNSKTKVGMSDVIEVDSLRNDQKLVILSDVTQTLPLDNGLSVQVKKGHGLSFVGSDGQELYDMTEKNGLCSNNIVYAEYDSHGQLWGAADNGIFAISVPSPYSRFTAKEGLSGEVLTIEQYGSSMFVGTTSGLFRLSGNQFEAVPGVTHACWQLARTDRSLLAATANGLYGIDESGRARQFTTTATTAVLSDGYQCYTGETDGVYLTQITTGKREMILAQERVMKILRDASNNIWVQSLYGEVWYKPAAERHFKHYRAKKIDSVITLVLIDGKVVPVNVDEADPVPYPQFSYAGTDSVTWLTNSDGRALYRWKNGERLTDLDHLLYPFKEMVVRAMYQRDGQIWLGGADGIVIIDASAAHTAFRDKPKPLFRSVILNGDKVLWGGYGPMPDALPALSSSERNLRFTFALAHESLVGKTLYRYRLNNDEWSVWEEDRDAEFLNLPYGRYSLEVQAMLANGQLSKPASISFSIAYPFYLRWYMITVYILLGLLLIYALFRYRLHRLNVERRRLADTVKARTAEVVKQKDEIEEKSKSLEQALNELNMAQSELIRQEKMATVGKLTKGLIDRILNPLNYINNFSKLSEGLVKDIEANIEDDKDAMDAENYEDTKDVLSMLRGNLQKVSLHGQNTTRTLKAMEEMLKDRSGGIVAMDLLPVLKQDEKMLQNYYASDISKYGIRTVFTLPGDAISMNGNADQLSKTLMSLLGNSVYAVVKKAQRGQYEPEVSLSAVKTGGTVTITIRDNGIGIEPAIIGKIFDPFFTTKPTGEASGVGLYLSHEIIQNHGGTISVKSEKDTFTEFTITLPVL